MNPDETPVGGEEVDAPIMTPADDAADAVDADADTDAEEEDDAAPEVASEDGAE